MRTLIPTLVSTGFALAAATLCGCGRGEVPIRGRFVSVTNGAVPRHLVLEGTPTEMGRAAGRLLGPEIRAAAGRPLPIALLPSLEHYAEAMRPLASAAMLEELDAMAREAGVSAADLFLRESSRDGLRWHGSGGPPRAAAFASAPGDGPDVVVAFAGADLDPRAGSSSSATPSRGGARSCWRVRARSAPSGAWRRGEASSSAPRSRSRPSDARCARNRFPGRSGRRSSDARMRRRPSRASRRRADIACSRRMPPTRVASACARSRHLRRGRSMHGPGCSPRRARPTTMRWRAPSSIDWPRTPRGRERPRP